MYTAQNFQKPKNMIQDHEALVPPSSKALPHTYPQRDTVFLFVAFCSFLSFFVWPFPIIGVAVSLLVVLLSIVFANFSLRRYSITGGLGAVALMVSLANMFWWNSLDVYSQEDVYASLGYLFGKETHASTQATRNNFLLPELFEQVSTDADVPTSTIDFPGYRIDVPHSWSHLHDDARVILYPPTQSMQEEKSEFITIEKLLVGDSVQFLDSFVSSENKIDWQLPAIVEPVRVNGVPALHVRETISAADESVERVVLAVSDTEVFVFTYVGPLKDQSNGIFFVVLQSFLHNTF
jgi:hypothetical protein